MIGLLIISLLWASRWVPSDMYERMHLFCYVRV